MVNHGALEPTKMGRAGRIVGASTGVPMATGTNALCEPPRRAASRTACSACRVGGVAVDQELAALDAGELLKAEPVVRRQLEQRQFMA